MCDSPFWVVPKAKVDAVPVPCGRCPPCKIRRVNSWVFRLQQEQMRSITSHFITLTYDTQHVPITNNGFMTLCKEDLQKYFKRLRKLEPLPLKYYAVGEYGSTYKRPHYHAIVFNVQNDENFYNAWSLNGVNFGTVHVGNVTSDSMAYCMKYIDKKSVIPMHKRDDRLREFPLMSKKLGDNFISEKIKKYYHDDLGRMFVTNTDGFRLAMPKYYREKIFDEKQRKQQLDLVQIAVDEKRANDMRDFSITYEDTPEYTYEQHLEQGKLARYYSFYSNQKNRDI